MDNNHPKLAYGLQVPINLFSGSIDDLVEYAPTEWFDTLKEVEDAIEQKGRPQCYIAVYGLSTRLTTIHFVPYGIAMGYHYFGIHPDHIEMASKYGITDDLILEKSA